MAEKVLPGGPGGGEGTPKITVFVGKQGAKITEYAEPHGITVKEVEKKHGLEGKEIRVNGKVVPKDTVIEDGTTIVAVPPAVSGG